MFGKYRAVYPRLRVRTEFVFWRLIVFSVIEKEFLGLIRFMAMGREKDITTARTAPEVGLI